MILSVIIPVYNVKTYLRHCLDSVIEAAARVGETEIICVDDGSTDGSSELLGEYAARGCLRVVSSAHSNAGTARNRGMEEACGRYLYFCDADDFMDPEMLEDLVGIAERERADVVCTGNRVLSNQTRKIVRIDRLSPAVRGPGLIVGCGTTVWNKLFRREYVFREGLRFEEIKRSDDVLFVTLALLLTERLAISEQTHYVYRQGRAGSLETQGTSQPLTFAESFASAWNEMRRRRPAGTWPSVLVNAVLTHFRYNIDLLRQDPSCLRMLFDALQGQYFDLFSLGAPECVSEVVRQPDRALLLVVRESRRTLQGVRRRLEEREAKLQHIWHWHEYHRQEKEKARSTVRDLKARLDRSEAEVGRLANSIDYRVGHMLISPLRFLRRCLRCK